jgi:hypothetical protein
LLSITCHIENQLWEPIQGRLRSTHQSIDILHRSKIGHATHADPRSGCVRKHESFESLNIDSISQYFNSIRTVALALNQGLLSSRGVSESGIHERANNTTQNAVPACQPVAQIISNANNLVNTGQFGKWCSEICSIEKVKLQNVWAIFAPESP